MIADALKTESPAVGVVEVGGISTNGWGDAVWQAIAPILGRNRPVIGLGVLRHHHRALKYHVKVRLVFTTGPSVPEAKPRLPMLVSRVETELPHQGDVSCVARPAC